MSVYIVTYIGIDRKEQQVEVSGHGLQQAVHKFFDTYTPVWEVLTVQKEDDNE